MTTEQLVPNDHLAAEIQRTIAIVGVTQTARALQIPDYRALKRYVERRAFPAAVVKRAAEIGLIKTPLEASNA